MIQINRRRVRWLIATIAIVFSLTPCCVNLRYYYVRTYCESRLIWSDTRLLLVIRITESHVRVTPLGWFNAIIQWNLQGAANHDSRTRQYMIVCEARDGRVDSTVCDAPGTVLRLTPFRGEVYAEQYMGEHPSRPWRWTGSGFKRADESITAQLKSQRFDGAPTIEQGWHADDTFDISSFRESLPPLTSLGRDLHASASIEKWCVEGKWNSPKRVRFMVSLPNGESRVIDLDCERRRSDETTFYSLPDRD